MEEIIKVESLPLDKNTNTFIYERSMPLEMYSVKRLHSIGEGGYARVYLGLIEDNSVALKVQRLYDKKGELIKSTLIEIAILRRLSAIKNKNCIISILGIVYSSYDRISIIMPYYKMTLSKLIKSNTLTYYQRNKYVYQCIYAISILHSRDILHLDIKPNNILYDSENDQIILTDFGMSVQLQCVLKHKMNNNIFTRWYAPPEIFLGALNYGKEVDIWALGCVIYEILTGIVLFRSDSEIDHLFKIFQLTGTPVIEMNQTNPYLYPEWPGVNNYPYYSTYFPKWSNNWNNLFNMKSNQHVCEIKNKEKWLNLLSKCLTLYPVKRASIYELLDDELFYIFRTTSLLTEPTILTSLDNLYLREENVNPNLHDGELILDELIEFHKKHFTSKKILFMAQQLIYQLYKTYPHSSDYILWCKSIHYIAVIFFENNDFYYIDFYLYHLNINKEAFIHEVTLALTNSGYDIITSTSIDFLHEYLKFYSSDIIKTSEKILMFVIIYPSLLLKPHQQALLSIFYATKYHNIEYKHDKLFDRSIIESISFNSLPYKSKIANMLPIDLYKLIFKQK